ncbi:MAG TPA: hypothetical protein VKY19_28455 [Ktedonosporobacter sp.]|jgi:uncharacterized membrane protein YgdD (TMEM256/DUF423 family)|nr:hypothetical protein [Ktedonosporobacter sp.]
MKNTFPSYWSNNSWSTKRRFATVEMQEPEKLGGSKLIQYWNDLTALPEALSDADFATREMVRKSRLTSNVLFFFLVMVIALLPACFIAPYPSYFWLDLGLVVACLLALMLNKQGYTLAAGLLVNCAGFMALTIALFSTIPFDETTLQGYDMYVIVELLAVSLLPIRSIFIVAIISTICIIGTLFYMPHTVVLDKDLQTRFWIIIARPTGTLFLVAGVAYILSATMATAIRRAGRAELIAQLEHSLAEQRHELARGVEQILATHVAVANGDLTARAPLTQDNKLWQVAKALNTLLVRFQRAVLAERRLALVDRAVAHYVQSIQQAERQQQLPVLPLARTNIDPLIVALQGKTIGLTHIQAPPDHLTGGLSIEKKQFPPDSKRSS